VPSAIEDQEEWRLQEAMLLRAIIEARLTTNPGRRLVVLGDFNDVKDSRTIKTIVGHGATSLFDTRPAERTGEHSFEAGLSQARRVTWTEYYAREDVYSRIDYILVSRSLERDWLSGETYVLNLPDWGLASDHRPLVAGFLAN
jgi:endonuclease/exonuclease/phosphatase family metal-dependent hydrolase